MYGLGENMRRIPRGTLILVSLATLIVFSVSLYNVVDRVDQALFMAQWDEKVRTVNLFCDEVDRYVIEDQDWLEYDYATLMRGQAQEMDAWPNLFAALYGDDMNLLTDRTTPPGEILMYPVSDPMIRGAVHSSEQGEFTTRYHGENSAGEEIRVYYRWVPSGPGYEHKILFIIAMRERPLDSAPSAMLIRWCILLIALTGVINLVAGISYAATSRRRPS
ncbi:hypothetical protein AGMMS49992_25430 [Clostridia bacterium]|nr:hypothetical protein AGMMS49992_25430 [Clostridia bacterium]